MNLKAGITAAPCKGRWVEGSLAAEIASTSISNLWTEEVALVPVRGSLLGGSPDWTINGGLWRREAAGLAGMWVPRPLENGYSEPHRGGAKRKLLQHLPLASCQPHFQNTPPDAHFSPSPLAPLRSGLYSLLHSGSPAAAKMVFFFFFFFFNCSSF